jgi:hypothetical protein
LELEQRLNARQASSILLLLNQNIYKWRTIGRVWYVDFHQSVTRQVVAGRPSHMAERPRGPTTTNFWLQIPCYRLLESVTVKPARERLQSGADWPGGLAGRPPPGSTTQRPLHTASSCKVHFWGDTYFGGILNFFIIS